MNRLLTAKSQPILLDANILMVGIREQNSDPNYSFESMKDLYLNAMFGYFDDIKIHDEVFNELDQPRQDFVKGYEGRNIGIVSENGLYGTDPEYTEIFNKVSKHDLFQYKRGQSYNKGEVYSLAYAGFYQVSYFSTRDGIALQVLNEVNELKSIEVFGFEYLLAIGYILNPRNKELDARFKSLYKSQCSPAIKQGSIP